MSRKLRAENGHEPEGGRGDEFRAKAGMKEGPVALRKRHLWTEEMREHLIFLLKEHPPLTHNKITERMNERFPERMFKVWTISQKCSSDIYLQHPELRRIRRRDPSYWTTDMVNHLAELRRTESRLTYEELAERMDRKFPGTGFTPSMIKGKLSREVLNKWPQLGKVRKLRSLGIYNLVLERLKFVLKPRLYDRYEEMSREAIEERYLDVSTEFNNEMGRLYDELEYAVNNLLCFPDVTNNVLALLALIDSCGDYKRGQLQWYELPERVYVIHYLRKALEEEDNQGLRDLAFGHLYAFARLCKDPRTKEEAEKLLKELKEKGEKNQ